jgi:hypothetical protein
MPPELLQVLLLLLLLLSPAEELASGRYMLRTQRFCFLLLHLPLHPALLLLLLFVWILITWDAAAAAAAAAARFTTCDVGTVTC